MKRMFALWFIGVYLVLMLSGCSNVEKDRECGTPTGSPGIELSNSKPPVANLPVEASDPVSASPGGLDAVNTPEPSEEPVISPEVTTMPAVDPTVEPVMVVTADELLSGVGSISSWTLNIQYRESYGGELMKTDYVFEHSPLMMHQVEYPELAVADGDYDKYYDVESGMLYSTGVGGWFSMLEPEFSFKHAALIGIDFMHLIENPEVTEETDIYIVSGKCVSPIIDTLTWNIFDETASRAVEVIFDRNTHELLGLCFEEMAPGMGIVIEISVSERNSTVVELPFNPDEVRFAGGVGS